MLKPERYGSNHYNTRIRALFNRKPYAYEEYIRHLLKK